MNKLVSGCIVASILAIGLMGFRSKTSPEIGNYAPQLSLNNINTGEKYLLNDSEGQYTLLHFWSATDAHSRYYNKIYQMAIENHATNKIRYVAVNLDVNNKIAKEIVDIDHLNSSCQYVAELGGDRAIKDFKIEGKMKSFIIDGRGEIVSINPTVEDLKLRGLI